MLLTGRLGGGLIRTRHANVVSRRSTEVDAIDDPFVEKALAWIQAHLDGSLGVETIARGIGYSVPALQGQGRIARTLGTTVSETVRRIRLSAARELLTQTSLPIEEIALRCGFSCSSHLSLRLREAEGMTPLAYRRRNSDL